MAHVTRAAGVSSTRALGNVQSCGSEQSQPKLKAELSQAQPPGWRDPAQLVRASVANAAVGGSLGGRHGLALIRLAKVLAARAIGQGAAYAAP